MATPSSVTRHPHIILFDGVCNLCSAWVHFVYRRDGDGKFAFASVQSAAGQELLAWCGLPTDRYDTMVYLENGVPHTRSDAFLQIVSHFPAPWSWLAGARIVPRPLRNWCYDRIARNRYALFGQKDQCLVPSRDLAARFISP